jgi:hypothetical protein
MIIDINKEELRLVINALAELPYKVSVELISKIHGQVIEQEKKEEAKKEKVK